MDVFEALLDRQYEKMRHERLCAGIVAATAANLFAKEPVSPMEFVPPSRHDKPKPSAETEADQIALMAAFLGAGPGQPSNISKIHKTEN